MGVELDALTHEDFEQMSKQLLVAEGFVLEAGRMGQRVDLLGTAPDGRTVVVECRLARKNALRHMLNAVSYQLAEARTFLNADTAILIVSAKVPANWRTDLDLRIIERAELEALLLKHTGIAERFEKLAASRTAAFATELHRTKRSPEADALRERLRALPPGKGTFAEFEDLGVDILNYVFEETLGTPHLQHRSDDGLDRRDAVFPILKPGDTLALVRGACGSMFVVAEFKNSADAPNQDDVESLQQYLYVEALRTLGFLVTRKAASPSAEKARRRAWLEFKKLIVLLDEPALLELIDLREQGDSPERMIELQLVKFFSGLTP